MNTPIAGAFDTLFMDVKELISALLCSFYSFKPVSEN
jgi:hypothetical protein